MKQIKSILHARNLLKAYGIDVKPQETIADAVSSSKNEKAFRLIYPWILINHPELITFSNLTTQTALKCLSNNAFEKAIVLGSHNSDFHAGDVAIECIKARNEEKFIVAMNCKENDVNARDGIILTMACKYATPGIVKMLISHYKADPTLNDNNAILMAAKFQPLDVFKEILKHGGVMGNRKAIIGKLLLQGEKSEDEIKWIKSLCF